MDAKSNGVVVSTASGGRLPCPKSGPLALVRIIFGNACELGRTTADPHALARRL